MNDAREPKDAPSRHPRPAPDAAAGPAGAGHGPTRRGVVVTTALTGIATALPLATAPDAVAADAGTAVLRSDTLRVTVDRAFPRIVDYTDRATGATLHGHDESVTQVVIDSTARTPAVTTTLAADHARYLLTFDGGTRITVEIRVHHSTVTWRVTDIHETEALRVGTLHLPELAFLAVREDQPGATLLAARLELDKAQSGDTKVTVSADTPLQTTATGCAYAVLATDHLAAAIETNTVWDQPSGADQTWENGRLWRRTVRSGGKVTARLGCGQFTHRAAGQPLAATEPLPQVTVIVTGDRNGDGKTDWQDAAIAFRDIMTDPPGAEETHLRVVSHIPYNFASQATTPFLAALDNVKRIALATDGLRQFTLLKGYQSEGHDSAHPDYGGNYNTCAGGLADLNTCVRAGKKWNSDFAVHINATESYPVAHAFSETLVDKDDPQWDWLDQSYRIDPRRDLVSGDIAARLRQLRRETDPALNMLYIDVFRESGWNSDALQAHLHEQGWQLATEFANGLERSALWSHWANETDYGPDTSRGVNSQLIRFVRNHQKDVFADRWPTLLGAGRMGNFEGWTGKTDWNAFLDIVWRDALPAKYLQAYPISTWTEHTVTFEGPTRTRVTDADGTRRIITDDRLVYEDGRYLLPWEPRNATDPDKLYHYHPGGGTSTWQLPRGWAKATTVHVHRLTDQGRSDEQRLAVHDGHLTLTAEPKTAYVVYRHRAPAQPDPGWGEGTALADPGFHSGTLDAWQVTGAAEVRRNDLGDYELVLPAGAPATVSQRLRRLTPGRYVASADVEVGTEAGQRRRAELAVTTADGVRAVNWTQTSTAANFVAADRKSGTRFQRMFTLFTVPEGGGPATLTLGAGKGEARVRFDNVRVVATGRPQPAAGLVAAEDFEHVPQGWGVFYKGDAGGTTDPRTHVAQRHARYTQRGWNGKAIDDIVDGTQSLKSRGENTGLVYRTVPHSVRFLPGRRYRVTFRFENGVADQYAWITAADAPATRELSREPLPVAHEPATHSYEFTAPADGEAWVGLRKTGDDGTAEFALDAFEVREV
ncbi:endo-alpha-N-acetylgalactosaminidase family protein [Streptomyces sp. NPDC059740]|uniref:endo-alpha-N-acetylgalactosaminidase family protein n=1 Tax=Streptomyces sp. NPDC059740 TaxID=3346926 RepID=UPI0036659B96